MKAVLHQPYFLPWLGYFSKLAHTDIYLVLDNVNFTKGSYIDRTRVISSQGNIIWIGVNCGQNYNKKCNDIYINDNFNLKKLIKTIRYSYSKARYFKSLITSIEEILYESINKPLKLSESNIRIVIRLMKLLNLKIPRIEFSSSYEYIDDATDRIIYLCEKVGSNQIILGSGGSLDIHDIDKIVTNGIDIFFQDYFNNHPTYYQTRRQQLNFEKGLSILDCLFNEGIDYTKSILLDEKYIPKIFKTAINVS